MKNKNHSGSNRLTTRALWCLSVIAVLSAFATPASAANYVVFGKVHPVNPAEAADEDGIATADLALGDALPFIQVAIFDRATDTELGRAWSLANGQFSIALTAPSPVDIEGRAFLVADGGLTPLPAAREEINHATLTSLGPNTSVGLVFKVASDLIAAAGPAALGLPGEGVGIVFTRVGKVEIPYICQEVCSTPATCPRICATEDVGLADMSGDLPTASQLGLPNQGNPTHYRSAFEQAPFGGRLMIFGDFGKPKAPGTGLCPPVPMIYPDWDPQWYQVTIEKLDETTFTDSATATVTETFPLADPISKKKYTVVTSPLIDVITSAITIGPYSGKLGSAAGAPVPGLYLRNELTATTSAQTFYSFPDLRVNWVTSGRNGLYRLKMHYFKHKGWETINQTPIVEEISADCFLPSPLPKPPSDSDSAVHDLLVRVNNQPLLTSFDHIWQKNAAGYLKIGPAPTFTRSRVATDPIGNDAFDFNAEGLCNIMHFDAGDQVEIDFTAHHVGGYLRNYALSASSNDGSAVPFTSDTFQGKPLLWEGTPAAGQSATNTVAFPHDCGYFFDLVARSRVQNGYGYIQGRHARKTYYVDIP